MLNYRWVVSLILILMVGLVYPQASWANEPTDPITVLESTPTHLVLELTVPEFELAGVDDTAYQQISLGTAWAQWGEMGQPQLPMWSGGLGLPMQTEPSVEILAQEVETLPNYRAVPAPMWSLANDDDELVADYEPDQAVYAQNRFLPGRVAEIAELGLMRDQAIGQLRLYPFQYNPATGELQVYRRLRVKVTYPAVLGRTSRTVTSNAAFEQVLGQTLLNYEVLGRSVSPSAGSGNGSGKAQPRSTSPQIKIFVEESGLYQLTWRAINNLSTALGNADPRLLTIRSQGTEIASYFEGDADSQFEVGERFIFYAQAIDSFETKQNVYWLSLGTSNGLRISEGNATASGGAPATSFKRTEHFEENRVYWALPLNGEDKDHWYWTESETSSSKQTSYSFNLADRAAISATDELRVSLYGSNRGFNTQLKIQLYLNGTPLLAADEQVWPGNTDSVVSVAVSQDLLNSGSNQLILENIVPDGSSRSTIYLNWFELDYQATYQTYSDQLAFASPDDFGTDYQMSGFTSDNIYLFDISQTNQPIRLVNGTISGGRCRLVLVAPTPRSVKASLSPMRQPN